MKAEFLAMCYKGLYLLDGVKFQHSVMKSALCSDHLCVGGRQTTGQVGTNARGPGCPGAKIPEWACRLQPLISQQARVQADSCAKPWCMYTHTHTLSQTTRWEYTNHTTEHVNDTQSPRGPDWKLHIIVPARWINNSYNPCIMLRSHT